MRADEWSSWSHLLTRVSIKYLVVLSSIVFLTASCAGGTATPSSEFMQPTSAPGEPAAPATTSPSAVVSEMTPTPSPASLQPAATPIDDSILEVEVGDYYFQPQVVTVTVGTTVAWIPVGDLFHTIVSKESPPVFRDDTAGSGSKPARFTFRKPGIYAYFCDYHPGAMDAWVVVIEGN